MTSAIKIDAGLQKQLGDLVSQYSDAQKREVLDHLYESPWTLDDPNGPYPWQVEFHNNPAVERGLLAANQVGKSLAGSAEVAIHATGMYPEWWTGHRFDGPIDAWVGSETNEASRDIVQKGLLGGIGQDLGTGMIPGRCIKGRECKPKMRQCGVSDVIDQIKVRHVKGGFSVIGFKSYDQGRAKWQGTKKHLIWLDEEPPQDIYTEAQTRTINQNGRIIMTFTPLQGIGEVVRKFLDHKKYDGVWMKNVGWDDAPHMGEEVKRQMLASYPKHERDARTKGLPSMGMGVVFPFDDDELAVDSFTIPSHFKRICGIDFGINHPASAVWLALDSDTGTVYVTDCYRQSDEGAAYHAGRINANADSKWIPVSWPHDGMNREKGTGHTLAQQYRKHGVNMMAVSARANDDSGGRQDVEATVMEMYNLMKQGQFKVFRHLADWFEEKRAYHRDKHNKIVADHDDIMAATRYGVMMLRYAISGVQADRMHNPLTEVEDVGYDPTSGYDY